MLTEIKDRATGWIAWIIVVIISIPFALWGVNEYFAGGTDLTVATVNGEEVSQQAYRYSLDERRNMARRVMGSGFDPDTVNSLEFRAAVLDDLIARELLNQETANAGYRVSDQQLANFIQTTPQFQRDGRFDQPTYQAAVRSLGYSTTGFENYLRGQNIVQQLRDGFSETAFVTGRDRDHLNALAEEQRTFDYTSIDTSRFEDQVEISEDEIVARYEQSPELYTSPEQMKIEYVVLSVEDFAREIEVTEEDVVRYYEDNEDRYTTPAQRTASHILITLSQDADEAAEAKALEKTQSLVDRIRSGEDFAELAETYSEDPGSAALGGDLGTVEPGIMVKPFEDALYTLQEGAISDPVRTRFGYHIIKLTGLTKEQVKPLEEVRDEIMESERQRMAENLFIEYAETFRNLAYEQPESLEPVIEELGLEPAESDWFSIDAGSGIAEDQRIRDVAFSDEVFIEGLNSEAIELDINTLVALRKTESQPAAVRPLDEVRDEVSSQLRLEAAREEVRKMGEQMLENLRGDADWDGALEDANLESNQTTQTRISMDAEPSFQVSNEVFRSASPDQSPVFGGVVQLDGTYVLFRLTDVSEGAPAVDENTGIADMITDSLSGRRGSDYFLNYQRGLRQAAKVEIFEENL